MPMLSEQQIRQLTHLQQKEKTYALLYYKISKQIKDDKNKKILQRIAKEKIAISYIWQQYTKQNPKVNFVNIFIYLIINYLLGYTFIIKYLETRKYKEFLAFKEIKESFPEISFIISQEEHHEKELINMLNEERLHYIGAMVLGLNDALVELTGTIAGLTFVLMNTKLIALTGIITGIAATLSMAASNYLAEKANGNKKAFIASCYTGIAYLITVIFLTLPYLIFPNEMYLYALFSTLFIVISLIFIFSVYISIIRSEKITKRFLEMTFISLSVTIISFFIGFAISKITSSD